MSFRSRQSLHHPGGSDVVFDVLESNERGFLERKLVNQSQVVLPDVETTELSALLAAGIDPKRVNSRILQSRDITTDLSELPSDSGDSEQSSNDQSLNDKGE